MVIKYLTFTLYSRSGHGLFYVSTFLHKPPSFHLNILNHILNFVLKTNKAYMGHGGK